MERFLLIPGVMVSITGVGRNDILSFPWRKSLCKRPHSLAYLTGHLLLILNMFGGFPPEIKEVLNVVGDL